MVLEEFVLLESEIDAEASWRLLDWCIAHGADEVSFELVPCEDPDCLQDEVVFGRAFRLITPIIRQQCGPAEREGWTYEEDGLGLMSTALWTLDETTVRTLQTAFPRGLFRGGIERGAGGLNAPIVYRGGALMLAFDPVGDRAILRVTQHERFMLERAGFTLHLDY